MTPHDYLYIGTLIGTILYLRRDVNGLGYKTRKMAAEIVILSKDNPKFEEIVRRLLG